ncbi:MAG TPA: outer membrane lipoprotein chaperone LolA [Steroidobacteraceae bacterium]|nr:outer membrane lipoprotein chaperone LolA [Steroidobacteraceae bacterium]
MHRYHARAAAALLGALTLTAFAANSGVAALDRYFDGLRSLTADFTETMTDAQGHPTQQATGRLLVLRPGRFRWEIHPKGEGAGQLLVADGRNLWYYDSDLEQVTVKPEQAALTATPAMLLSGGPNALAAFDVSAAGAPGEAGGTPGSLDWVRVAPKAADADFREALLGFSGNHLQRMVLKDKLGGTATIVFQSAERNAPVSEAEVSFTPPAGVDVIGNPAK